MLVIVACSASLIVAVEAGLLVGPAQPPAVIVLSLPCVGLIYVVAGCFAWDRRPSNSTGMLLALAGLTMLTASLINTSVPVLASIGAVTATLFIAVICQLFLSFPSGTPRRIARWLVVSAYLNAIVLQAPQYLFGSDGEPYGLLGVADRPDLAVLGGRVQAVAGSTIFAVCVVVVLRRPSGLDPARRRVLRRLAVVWGAMVAGVPFSANVLAPVFDWSPAALYLVQVGILLAVPIAFTAAALAGAFARMRGIEELANGEVWTGSSAALEARLRAALGDPSARVWFWSVDAEQYVDASGSLRDPTVRPARGVVTVALGEREVGLVEYDSGLLPDSSPVVAAANLIALEVDRQRLAAELRAQQAEVAASRARLAVVADAERRRIARDLHDAVQGRLLVAALRLDDLPADDPALQRPLADVRHQIAGATNHLRWVVAGVMPRLLSERGLFDALRELAEQLPLPVELDLPPTRRLPSLVESTAYFAVAEALTNVVKHARATRVTIRAVIGHNQLTIDVDDDGIGGAELGPGSGLIGIVDRLDVLGGGLTIRTVPGAGTGLSLELPCVW